MLIDAGSHEIFDSDIKELVDIIRSHGSAKQWCMYLSISDSTCNQIDFSQIHYDDVVVDVAKAYLDETLKPCWEDIVTVLCRHLMKKKFALKLSRKHNVNYYDMCHGARMT